MIKNYLKIALRNIKKHKSYSFINITGLAFGLAAFILIALYVQYELSFDRYHDNANRIYRAVRDKPSSTFMVFTKTAVTPAPLGPALVEEFPEVLSAMRIIKSQQLLISHEKEHFLEQAIYWADAEVFEIFSIPFIKGDPQTALNNPKSIVLSERMAAKYFGNKDPVGRILTVSERYHFNVSGVFTDMPANSHFIMDLIVPYETYFQITNNDIYHWGRNFSYTYILLQEGSDPEALESKIPAFLDKYVYKDYDIPDRYKNIVSIQPLTDIHLHSHRNQEIESNSDIVYVILSSSIALLFLLIACINYMNLATARSGQRAKEVGMRKVVGAQRKQLIMQFLSESVAMTFMAMIISIIIVLIVLPAFNNLVERQLSLNPLDNQQLFIGLVGIVLFVGLLAGSYPAICISGFRPIPVISRTFIRRTNGMNFRNILVLTQFSITIFFIIFTFIVRDQLNFVNNKDMGYTRDQIITLEVQDRKIRQNIEAIKTELLRYSNIVAITTSYSLPNDIDEHTDANWPGRNPDMIFPIYYNMADYDFVELFDIKISEGRNFSRDFPSDRNGAFLVNESTVRAAQWESPLGQKLIHFRGNTGKIVGIMKDFHLHSLHRPIEPVYIYLDPKDFSYISIKIKSANIPVTIDYIKGVMKKFSPSYPFDYSFFDDIFEKDYRTEQRMGIIFSSFAVLAIIFACMGLLGLATFAAEQRTKEIGIRKVLGASISSVFLLCSKEFLKWVLLSNIIAWPIAYYAINKWLQNFVYRVNIGIEIFILSASLAIIVAMITMSYQSIKAALANPVESLRYE
ncbi:MAG: ABC transporter permease [bacterium]|nr:MAG: ABC transporter permease [bacterium]